MSDERGVLDLQVEPPVLMALDTRATAVTLLEDQPSHPEYSAFLLRAVERRTTFAYCELVDLELAQACSKRARAWHAGDRSLFVPEGRRLIAEVFGRRRAIISQTQSVRMPLGSSDDPRVLGWPVRDAAFGSSRGTASTLTTPPTRRRRSSSARRWCAPIAHSPTLRLSC